ncbi:Mu transposase C-terminal domain-containing protein [Bradyrhizobium diazoefficiens]|uniref:Mu transposase C-terminal domain-containing protein n=1 Tax=Bradyrhizobium diazoefficiens TaxID=1355477 RepID=UPI002729EC75|nr:Mu transposase C-terminal domain-containing protein [Bradyrhizobium diazoefficiens]WLA64921.1 Mu transposase C-terminal domain-containing protein [Bradyrhizobium diazoefficiens]
MFNFIRNIIDRLHGFIRSDARDATEPTAEGVVHSVPDETDVDGDLGRFDSAALTSSGIRFHGIRYHSAELAQMLLSMKPGGDHVKVRIKDPSDASSIFVWNSTARPTARWITVGSADGPIKLSFAQHAVLRNFARTEQCAFSTDAERSEALERLAKHWENLADQPLIRENRLAQHVADPCDGPSDDAHAGYDSDLRADALSGIEVAPLVVRNNQPRGRKPSKPAIAKAKRTKARKIAEATAKTTRRVSPLGVSK